MSTYQNVQSCLQISPEEAESLVTKNGVHDVDVGLVSSDTESGSDTPRRQRQRRFFLRCSVFGCILLVLPATIFMFFLAMNGQFQPDEVRPDHWEAVRQILNIMPMSEYLMVAVGNGQDTLFQWQGPMYNFSKTSMNSLSKMITATMIMRLVERGVLGLDDPVSKWLTFWPTDPNDKRSRVTLRHCMSMTSGFFAVNMADLRTSGFFHANTTNTTNATALGNTSKKLDASDGHAHKVHKSHPYLDFVQSTLDNAFSAGEQSFRQLDCGNFSAVDCARVMLANSSHIWEPGTVFSYHSNHLVVAAAVVYVATGGKSLTSVLNEEVFLRCQPPIYSAEIGGSSLLASSIKLLPADFATFVNSYVSGRLLSESSMREMQRNQISNIQARIRNGKPLLPAGSWTYGFGLWLRKTSHLQSDRVWCGDIYSCSYDTSWFGMLLMNNASDAYGKCLLQNQADRGCKFSVYVKAHYPEIIDGWITPPESRMPGTPGAALSSTARLLSKILNRLAPLAIDPYSEHTLTPSWAWLPGSNNTWKFGDMITCEPQIKQGVFPTAGVVGYQYLNIGLGAEGNSYMTKIRRYVEWLHDTMLSDPNRLVIVADAKHVVYGGCSETDLLFRYRRIVGASEGATVVFGGQLHGILPGMPQQVHLNRYNVLHAFKLLSYSYSWYTPPQFEECGNVTNHTSCPIPTDLEYLNLGFAMGPAKWMHHVFKHLLLHNHTLHGHELLRHFQHTVTLDTSGTLIADLGHSSLGRPGFLEVIDGRLWNNVTNLTQCFAVGSRRNSTELTGLVRELGQNKLLVNDSVNVAM